MGNSCSLGCRWWCLLWRLFVLSFFPLDVLDEIWDLIEPVSEGFLTYSFMKRNIYLDNTIDLDITFRKKLLESLNERLYRDNYLIVLRLNYTVRSFCITFIFSTKI